jgi:hypothetical protein
MVGRRAGLGCRAFGSPPQPPTHAITYQCAAGASRGSRDTCRPTCRHDGASGLQAGVAPATHTINLLSQPRGADQAVYAHTVKAPHLHSYAIRIREAPTGPGPPAWPTLAPPPSPAARGESRGPYLPTQQPGVWGRSTAPADRRSTPQPQGGPLHSLRTGTRPGTYPGPGSAAVELDAPPGRAVRVYCPARSTVTRRLIHSRIHVRFTVALLLG